MSHKGQSIDTRDQEEIHIDARKHELYTDANNYDSTHACL